MDQFKKVSRDLFLQKYERYLPTAFDESLTILEKVNKIIEMLIRYGQLSDELVDYLNQFKLEFDDKLKNNVDDIVDRMLNQWLQDGVLFNLIDEKYGRMYQDFIDSYFYDEITVKTYQNANGEYYVTTIPTHDKHDRPIEIYKEFAFDDYCAGQEDILETSVTHATRNKTSLTINASRFNVNTNMYSGIQIKDGIVHRAENNADWTLGYKRDEHLFEAYPKNVTAETMIADGVTDTFAGFHPLVINGERTDSTVYGSTNTVTAKHPRQVIAQLKDKTIQIFTFRGREYGHEGYTYEELITVLMSHGVNFAYNLDGGGSTQTIKSGILVNSPIDSKFTEMRKVSDFINVKKPINKAYEDFYKVMTELSVDVRAVKSHAINKYDDHVPGRLYFKNFLYLLQDKFLYAELADGGFRRLLGVSGEDPRLYLGFTTLPLTVMASHNPAMNVAGTIKRFEFRSTDAWQNILLEDGFSHVPLRNLQFKYMNEWETRVRGAFYIPTNVTGGTKIGELPAGNRPTQNMYIPVVVNGVREPNSVLIATNGSITLGWGINDASENTFVQIECVINKGE